MTRIFFRQIIRRVEEIGADARDGAETRELKRLLMRYAVPLFWIGLLWGALYYAFGEKNAAWIPWAYSILSAISVLIFAHTRNYRFFLLTQLTIILFLPFALQLALGGFINSSAVVLWSVVAPMSALIFAGPRQALAWFIAYLILVATSGVLQDYLRPSNNLPPLFVLFLFVLNICAISTTAFVLLSYFMSQREKAFALLRLEEEKSNNLLLNILPAEIAFILKETNGRSVIADHYDTVTILFADMVNFTPLSAELSPGEMVGVLNEIFSHFDALVDECRVEKIETVGDEYMAACGVPRPCPDHAASMARLALGMCRYTQNFRAINGRQLQIRVGIHSGPVVAGVIGKKKFAFELFGDTVNTANRMQSHGVPGKIQVTRETYELLKDDFICEPRGTIDVKGKGEMETWFLVAEKL